MKSDTFHFIFKLKYYHIINLWLMALMAILSFIAFLQKIRLENRRFSLNFPRRYFCKTKTKTNFHEKNS